MTTTVQIENSSIEAINLIEQIRTLPYVKVIETKKQSFEEAVRECNGRPASEFFDELRKQVKEHFNA